MAILSEQQYQDLIIAEVGDDAAASLASTVPLYWLRRSGIADLDLRYLYAKRDAIDLMLGKVRGLVKIVGVDGASVDAHQLTLHLQELRIVVEHQIVELAQLASSGGVAGVLTTTAPIMPPTTSPYDANDGAYRGSTYRVSRRRLP